MWRVLPKLLFFGLVVKPLAFLVLGLVVSHRERLPRRGPAILVANHNSHLDTLVLMSLFPLRDIPKIRPVAAEDYFLSSRWRAWFSLNVIGIVPIARRRHTDLDALFAPCRDALARGEIVIVYPEGTRGEPEKMSSFKRGVYHLARSNADHPVTPIFLYGLGKALPKGEALLVPFNVYVVVGDAARLEGDAKSAVQALEARVKELAQECRPFIGVS